MSRRTLRSARAHVCLEPVLVLPDSLRGTIPPLKNPTKRVKKEHEDGVFAVVRRERSAEPIDVSLLRAAVNEYLDPDMDGLGRSALVYSACNDDPVAQTLITSALRASAAEEDWHELWILLGQIGVCLLYTSPSPRD